jgi:dTDP-4-dehydrorhamnose reductase
MKIIVTGDKGFLGKRLACKLREAHTVEGLNRSVGDLSNFKVVHDFISKFKPDVVVHCAAIGDIGTCEDNKEKAYKSNYIATKNIASACADNNSRMIYISSDQVYNAFTDEQINEMTETNPNNYYGYLKAMSEKDVQNIVPRSHIARIGWQYDWNVNGVEDSRGGIFELITKAVSTNTPIYYSSNSHQYISYVQDTIDALIKMAEKAVPYGIYNVTEETDKTIGEAFEFAMKALGNDDETIRRLLLAQEDKKSYNLCAKPVNLEMCGHKMPSFEEGVLRCIRDKKEDML